MPRWKKIVLGVLAIIFVAIAALLILLHTSFAKRQIATYVKNYVYQTYRVKVDSELLDYKLWPPLQLRVNGLKVYGGPSNDVSFLTSRFLEVVIPYSSFWSNNFLIKRLTINTPSLFPENLPRPQFSKKSTGTFQIDQVAITGGSLRYSQFRVQNVRLDAVVLPDTVQLKELWAKLEDFEFQANGLLKNLNAPVYDLTYQVHGDAKAISKMFPQVPPLSGPMQTTGTVHGETGFYLVHGQVNINGLSVSGQPPFRADGRYDVDSRQTQSPYHLNLTWKSLPLSIARQFEPQAPSLASESNGTLVYTGPANFWQGSATFHTNLDQGSRKGLLLMGHIDGNLRNGTVELADSALSFGRSRVAFSGNLNQSMLNVKLSAVVPNVSAFSIFVPSLRKVPGSYTIDSTIHGAYRNLQVDWTLNGKDSDFQIASTGSYFIGPRRINAQVSGEMAGSAIDRFYPAGVTGQIQFNATASGSPTSPVLHASLTGKSLQLKDTKLGDLTLQADSDGRVLNVVANLPAYSTTARADYQFVNHHYDLDTQFTNLTLDQLRPFLPASAQDVSGNLSGRLQASGNALRWRNSTAQVTLQQANLQRQDMQVQIDNGSVFTLKNQIATVDLHARMPQGAFNVQGTIPISARGTMNVHATGQTDLSIISLFTNRVVGQGALALDVVAVGRISRPVVTGNISSNQFTFSIPEKSIQLSQGSMQVQLAGDHAAVRAAASLNGSPFAVEGSVPLQKAGQMAVHVTGRGDLKLLSLVTDQVQGTGQIFVDVNLNGTIARPLYRGSIRSDSFAVSVPARQISLTQAKIAADFNGDVLHLDTAALLNGSALQVNGTLPMTETAGEVHVTLASFPLSTLAPDAGMSGGVSLKLDAQGRGRSLSKWSGLLTVTPQNLNVEGTAIRAEQPIRVQLTTGMAELQPMHITAGDLLDTSAQGRVNFHTGDMDVRVRSSAEMALISRFMTAAQASGALVTNLNISGKLNNPDVSGVVRVDQGVVRVPNSPLLLERIRLVAPIQRDRITVDTLTARMGGGTINGGGEILLTKWSPSSINLWVKATNVGIRYPEDLRSQLNADVKFTNATEGYLLSGKIQIARSTLRENIDPRQRLVNTLLSEKQALSPPTTSQNQLHLNLVIETLEDFQMRNNLGKMQAAANLQITGNLAVPRISGRVRVREGSEIQFEGNTFEVRRGIIDFYGRTKLDPVFDLELFATARDVDSNQDYEITMPLSGPLSNLDKRDPTSYPPLSPNQIYFLLLTGRADAQLSQASSRFFQQQMAAYISGQVFSDLERQLANTFGLQRVEVQPEVVSSETKPGAKLVLGKDFSSALSLIYTISLTESREQTWLAQYRAKRNLTFRFIDQDDGTYTTSVRHLVRFGPGASLHSLRNPHSPTVHHIATIQIHNNSPLPDDQIRKIIKVDQGDEYDYWNLQDALDKVKQKLQAMGYLFPDTEINQSPAGNSFNVDIEIAAREKREVVFQGFKPTKNQLNKYRKYWREGFSEEGVLEMIREDFLRGLWFQGYHKATIRRDTTRSNNFVRTVFTVTPGPLFKDVKFVFKGTQQYPADKLEKDLNALYPARKEMITDAIHNFHTFKDKLLALYLAKGFIDASVVSDDTKFTGATTAEKDVVISEGPESKITDVLISDGTEFPPDLRKKLHLWVGSIYNPQAKAADELTISEYYEHKGYRKFTMLSNTRKADGGGGLVLEYKINTGGVGKVNSVVITGNRLTSRDVIEKRVALKHGDILNQEKLADAQKNLTDLRIFHQVTVRPEETDVPNLYDIIVDVLEVKKYEVQYGFRYDTEKGVGGEAQFTNVNLFGTGQSASWYTRISRNNQLYRATYHSPTLAGLKWKTLISTSFERGDLFLRQANQFGLAEGQRYDFVFQRQREIWKPFLLVWNYEFQKLRTRPAIAPPDFPFDNFKISLLGAQVFADTRDDPINAHRGRFVSFDFQWSPRFLISDVNYVRSYSQYLNFKPFGRMMWASAIRLGVASSLGPRLITERFLAGGSYTIRGFKMDAVGPKDASGNPIGGEGVFIINQELRAPLYKWISGAVFYDAGNVYLDVGSFNPFRLRHSVGFGLRFDSPFGIVRGDIGLNLRPRDGESRYVLHFGLGQAF